MAFDFTGWSRSEKVQLWSLLLKYVIAFFTVLALTDGYEKFIAAGAVASNNSNARGLEALGPSLLLADGLAQAIGVTMLFIGMAGEKVFVRNDVARPRITPMRMGRDGAGVALTGAF